MNPGLICCGLSKTAKRANVCAGSTICLYHSLYILSMKKLCTILEPHLSMTSSKESRQKKGFENSMRTKSMATNQPKTRARLCGTSSSKLLPKKRASAQVLVLSFSLLVFVYKYMYEKHKSLWYLKRRRKKKLRLC